MARMTVVYYSSTGSVHALAEAFTSGAAEAGAEVRLRRVAELAPQEVIAKNADWAAHLEATAHIETVTVEDLVWADGFALGTPTRFGQPAAQLKQFLDTTSNAWNAGELAGKPATGFTSSYERHGGQESTLLALYHTLFHWGSIIVPTGYVDYDLTHAAGGNPYGVSSIGGDGPPNKDVLALARYQGGRLATLAATLAAARQELAAA
ncbi:NAD(P)H:quinone oxidoreductase, type IV [Prauserella marina]|uniref:NAD(P)H dehydrogenase (Quinone) n=1 Tax=Prauserella marina TaxID=530584 RepID=A0A222VW19_9PSEU|nr:NAD(P)H:quinone oxidoreductase [Prauserella marina]ASR38107.1 NAD(P)H:quinone oxidoreductase, type IV [Prauserella marina]PWV78735.1 NAD(P)H dehydrogenase (quinone) [Prauserella marina]SDC92486.1 NAD(P)H dehydrogenase (quinone) [Prauserella marina]